MPTSLLDTYRHKGLRKKLVEKLRDKGIHNEKVLDAINRVPRHFYLDSAFGDLAYADQALPIAAGQTISQPYTVAYQTNLLDLSPNLRVLEIGTGSGYQASILNAVGVKVYTIERHHELFLKTSALLKRMGYDLIRCYHRDGYLGIPEIAPFDRILVTAGATEVPKSLLDQLKIGGKLVIPVGDGNVQKMLRFTRLTEDQFKKEEFEDFRFVPLLKGKA